MIELLLVALGAVPGAWLVGRGVVGAAWGEVDNGLKARRPLRPVLRGLLGGLEDFGSLLSAVGGGVLVALRREAHCIGWTLPPAAAAFTC